MSYPPATYLGASGEVSASHRPADRPPDLVYPNGTALHVVATGAATNGAFGLYRWEMGPNAGGPGPHFHRTFSESFYVLAGSVQIFDGRTWLGAAAGAFVHVPQGGIHAFRNDSAAPASMLILFAPGAPREAYFEGLLGLAGMTDEERADFYRHHDNIWL